jgi:hypothetical protein
MKMLGHDYVADHHETIPLTYLFEEVRKKIATTSAAEQTPTLITTGGYEMQIAGAVVSLQTFGHAGMIGRVPASLCDG